MDHGDFTGQFREARRQVDSARTSTNEPRGRGEAAEGRVRVVAADGQVEQVDLDPRVMRMPAEELARHLRDAGNAALDELRAAAPADAAVAVDPAVLAQRLDQVANEGMRTMAMITQALEGAMDQVRERAGMSGDPAPRGLEQLLDRVRSSIPSGTAAGDDGDGEELRGEGSGAQGQVSAVVDAGGHLTIVTIEQRAMRLASADLAEQATAAINAALAEVRARSQERLSSAAAAGRSVDTEKLQELREESVRQMNTYATALSDLIASVYRR